MEESQMVLARDMRRLGNHPTEVQRLALARRADRLSSEISGFLSEAIAYLGENYSEEDPLDGSDWDNDSSDDDEREEIGDQRPDQVRLPLPSMLGRDKCRELGIGDLAQQELQLRTGQANDALHEIRIALADKAVLFRTDVRYASNQAKTTRAWGKVNALDSVLHRHASVYRRCRIAMTRLDADNDILQRYQHLRDEDLKVTTAAASPNVRGLRNRKLAWFWSIDVPRDTEANDWMSECRFWSPSKIQRH